MLQVSDEVWDALRVSPTVPTAVAQYQGAQIPLTIDQSQGGVTWDGDANLQARGTLVAVGVGGSLVPKARDAALAPTGQEVVVSRTVKTRTGDAQIPLGVFRITDNDGGRESFRWERRPVRVDAPVLTFGDVFPADDVFPLDDEFPGELTGGPFEYLSDPVRTGQVLDWQVGVGFADRFRVIERARLVNPASPPAGSSVYSELRRLALIPLQVAPDVPDRAVPPGTVYTDRRSAITLLAEIAGAKPRVTRQGALTLRPADRWLSETTLDFDLEGVVEVSESQTDEFYNYVWAHSPDGAFSAYAIHDDQSDPRAVSRAGIASYEHSSPVYVSQAAARAGAQTVLRRLLNRRSRSATVRLDGRGVLLDLSDYGRFTDPESGRVLLGEVSGLRVSHDPTQLIEVTVIVAEVS